MSGRHRAAELDGAAGDPWAVVRLAVGRDVGGFLGAGWSLGEAVVLAVLPLECAYVDAVLEGAVDGVLGVVG